MPSSAIQCCIVGGGPAGMMLGFLLARAGVEVAVLEKHADFFRDFRGDTIHPSTLRLLEEVGLLDEFLQLPQSRVQKLSGRIGGEVLPIADFGYLHGRCNFIAFTPQWNFLNFLAKHAAQYPSFRLEMQTQATGLLFEGSRVTGVRVQTPQGAGTISADLVVACDGRHSLLRERAGLSVQEIGVPIDALWMRLSRKPDDPPQDLGNVAPGGILVAINRDTYYQCACVIRKGGFQALQARGLQAFRDDIATIAPFLRGRVNELTGWDQIKLLSVRIDRLRQWYRPGLICIGDAAHAMSPIGGVGINLAIQDAVAAANILKGPLQKGTVSVSHLRAVQRRREFAVQVIQWMQTQIQNRVIDRVLEAQAPLVIPPPLRLFKAVPWLRALPAWLIGVGIRPERIR